MRKWGIDVSVWQGDFNFAKAKKEGIKFAILKCGGADGGLYTDSKFEENYKKCVINSIPCGAYFFSTATTVADARKEAKHVISLLKGKKFDYPIYMDVEAQEQIYIGARKLTDVVKAFLSTLESAGYCVGIYAGSWVISGLMIESEVAPYTKWIASYTETAPCACDMWQYGGDTNLLNKTTVAGVVCDQNFCYRDFPAEIKDKGMNGYLKNGWKLEIKGWCFYENGKKICNAWKADKKGWCYLGKDGYCVKNEWHKDSHDWCYVGSNGYAVQNTWVKDTKGWCYIGSNYRICRNIDTDSIASVDKDGHLILKGGKMPK